jgi:quercetin dioxygenase-like cupin family protein
MVSSAIFPKGAKVPNDHFIGTAWLENLVPADSTFNFMIGNVTFEPGARNNWHRHPGGQILLVTSGKGYYQEEGKQAYAIKKGDVVKILPNVKHWHGAAPDSQLVHVAISVNAEEGAVEWLEPVTEGEYTGIEGTIHNKETCDKSR